MLRRLAPVVLVCASACHFGDPIEVLRASPTGQLSGEPAFLEVQLDHAIVDPDQANSQAKGLKIDISPKLAGEVRFPTPASIIYTFAEAPKLATRYEVELDSGLRSFDGKAVLKSSYEFAFTTAVNGHAAMYVLPAADGNAAGAFPSSGERELRNLDLGERLLVELAYPAKVEELRRLVSVTTEPLSGGGSSKADVKIAYSGETLADRFIVEPNGTWPKHVKIGVHLAKGLHIGTAGAGPEGGKEETKSASTYGAIALISGPDCKGCKPPSTLLLEFSTPVSCDAALPFIRLAPGDADALHCAGQANETTLRLESTPALLPFTTYTLTVKSGVTDRFGQILETQKSFNFETGDATPRFAHQLMFNVLEKKLAADHEEKVYKTAKLEVEAARLSFTDAWKIVAAQELTDQVAWNDLPWWVENNYGDYYGGDCYYDEEEGTEVCDEMRTRRSPGETSGEVQIPSAVKTQLSVAEGDEQGWSVVPVPLQPYLAGKGGFVVVKSTPLDKDGKKLGGAVLRILNVTDIGLSAKYSPNQLVVLAARLSDGAPVSGAAVQVYAVGKKDGELGAPVSGTTDAQGVAVFSASGLTPEGEEPNLHARGLLVVASQNDDEAFMWSSFQSGGRKKARYESDLVGGIYTERGIYRPGETGYFRVVARKQTATGFATPAGQNVEIIIKKGEYDYDDGGEEIYRNTLTLSDFGAASGEFAIPKTAGIDAYRVIAKVGDAQLQSGIQVAEFRRAELKVNVQTDKTNYIRGQKLTAKVNADYLFGAPASGLPLHWTLRRSWGYYASARLPEARFSDYEYHSWYDDRDSYSEFLDEGQVTLDDNGSFTFARDLNEAGNGRVENLVVSATVDDASGQSVSSTTQVTVHPGDFHAGIVSHGYMKDMGKVMTFEVCAVSPDDKPVPGAELQVSMNQEVWYSVERKGPGGRLYWDYKHETLDDPNICRGKTNADGLLSCQYTPKKGGSLRLRVRGADKKGRESTASEWFWVTGDPDYYGGRSDGGEQVGVVPEAAELVAGKTARIAITTPFKKALALVTVEREDILWRKVLEVGTNTMVDIPVSSEWAPNVYVSATVVRGRLNAEGGLAPDPERDKPAYAIGFANLKVKPTGNLLTLKVASDKPVYEPGDSAQATVHVTNAAGQGVVSDVNLYAVDEGVLMLTAYRTPDLVDDLFRERPFAVLALDTRMHVLGQRKYVTPVMKGEDDGGGGGGDQADEIRKDFNPVALWVGSAITGADGDAKASFKVPDTLTTYRLIAVAVTKEAQTGSTQAAFKVNKTLMVRQALPRFVRPGDTVEAGVVVNHLLGDTQDVTVALDSIDANLFDVMTDKTQTKKVSGKETVAFRWKMKAKDVDGASAIVFSGKMGRFRDKVQYDLPVVRVAPRQSVGVAGVVEAGKSLSHTVSVPDGARALAFTLNLSGLPVASLEERIRNLVGYPYGCLEQRTSKVLPLMAVERLADKLHLASIPKDKIKLWVEEWVSLVPKYRCSDEGYDYYPGCGNGSDPYLTSYALEALVQAKKFGYAVPDDLLNRGANYLEGRLAGMEKNGSSWDHSSAGLASALHVLAELGRSKPSYESSLYEGRTDLPLFAKTELLRAVYKREGKRTPVVNTLLTEVTSGGQTKNGRLVYPAADEEKYWWAWDSSQRSTALVLRSLLEIVPDDARVPLIVNGLTDVDAGDGYYSTPGLTQTLLALAEAAEHLTVEKPRANLKVSGKTVIDGRELGAAVESVNVEPKQLGDKVAVELGNSGKGPLFFGGFLQFAYPATARLPAEREGFSVTRSYFDRQGKPIGNKVKVGDYVMVRVVIDPDEDGRMVVVDDPLPAGLEPVDTNLATSNKEMAEVMEHKTDRDWSWWQSRYSEMRDDRVEYHFRHVWAGSHGSWPIKLQYLTRAVTPGSYYAPGTHVERMYQPHIRGRAEGTELTVLPK